VRTLPGAGSTDVRALLTGPAVPGRLVGVHATCAYVATPRVVVAVETADGLGLPCSLRLGVDRATAPFAGLHLRDPALVGAGRVVVGAMTVPVVRWWAPRRPQPGSSRDRVDVVAGLLADVPVPVPVDGAVADLLGRGPGLTPAGDDVVAGLLLAFAHRPDLRDPLAAEVDRLATDRTTTLSATLLRCAAAGHAIPAVTDLADALAGHGPDAGLPVVVRRLVTVGHSSGAALAHGLLRGARTVAESPDQEAA
jgi:hypothetical protein